MKNNSFDWKDGLKILLAVITFGVGWLADNQATVISFSAVLIVWFIGLLLKYFEYIPNKSTLTILVFAVALGLTIVFSPVVLPIFPSWDGDAAIFAGLLVTYLVTFLQIASGVVAYATGIYNILLAQVLEKLPAAIGLKTA